MEEESASTQEMNILEENQNILTGKYYDHFKRVFEKNQEKALRYYEQPEEEKIK